MFETRMGLPRGPFSPPPRPPSTSPPSSSRLGNQTEMPGTLRVTVDYFGGSLVNLPNQEPGVVPDKSGAEEKVSAPDDPDDSLLEASPGEPIEPVDEATIPVASKGRGKGRGRGREKGRGKGGKPLAEPSAPSAPSPVKSPSKAMPPMKRPASGDAAHDGHDHARGKAKRVRNRKGTPSRDLLKTKGVWKAH